MEIHRQIDALKYKNHYRKFIIRAEAEESGLNNCLPWLPNAIVIGGRQQAFHGRASSTPAGLR